MLDDESLERQLAAEFSSGGDSGHRAVGVGEEGYGEEGYGEEGYGEDEDDDVYLDGDEDEGDLLDSLNGGGYGDDDELYDGPDIDELLKARRGGASSQTSSDVIEVYDEEGNLVGTYTDAEFDELRRQKGKR